jgi:hypothetical protein
MVERSAGKLPAQPGRRRGPGRPFVPGDPRINKAGRPPGRRRAVDEMLAKVGTASPLETLLTIMHTAKDQATRLKAAASAAPYCHPRLVADVGGHLAHQGDDERVERFSLTIFDHNGRRVQPVRPMLPPPDGDETQEGSDNDPAT